MNIFKFSLLLWIPFFLGVVPFQLICDRKFSYRKIDRGHPLNLIEILKTFILYQIGGIVIFHLFKPSPMHPGHGPICLIILFLVYDAYFYFIHRLIKKYHLPIINISFFLMITLLHLFTAKEMIAFYLFTQFATFFYKSGFEFFHNAHYRLPFLYLLNTVSHHNLQYENNQTNLGLFLRIWDEKFKTLHADTYNVFFETQEKIQKHFNRPVLKAELRALPDDIAGQFFEKSFYTGDDSTIFFELDGTLMQKSHTVTDGVGGLLLNLKEKNIVLTAKPESRSKTYTFKEKLKAIGVIFGPMKRRPCRWIGIDHKNAGHEKVYYKNVFSKDEVQSARNKARSEGITLNTLFIYEWTKVLQKHTMRPEFFTWAVPVSKRKTLDYNVEKGNQVWLVDATINHDDKKQFHQKLNFLYSDIDIYGGIAVRILKYPFRLFFHGVFKNQKRIGRNATFSNLGVFEGTPDMSLYFCPPTTAGSPFAIGCITYNGNCYFTLKSNSLLPFTESDLEKFFAEFKAALKRH
jgi:hypothetical protein